MNRLRISATLARRLWVPAIIAALLVSLAVCEARGWPFLRGPLQEALSRRLDRDVVLGDVFSLKLLGSIRLATSTLRVGAPNGLPRDPTPGSSDLFLDAHDARIDVPYGTVFSLWGRDRTESLRIASLRVARLDVVLKRSANGRSNWAFAAPGAEAPSPRPMVVDELVLDAGHLVLDDAPTRTTLNARLSTREGSAVAGQSKEAKAAGLVVEGTGRWENRRFQLRASSAGVMPLITRDRVARTSIRLSARVEDASFDFDGSATDLLGLHSLEGAASFAGPSMAKVGDALGITLPTTAPFTLKGVLRKSGPQWAFGNATLDVGRSHLGGDFTFDRRPTVPVLRGELNGSQLVLADLAPAFGAAGTGTANPKPPPGRVLPQREFDIPSLRAMNASVKVQLKRADLGSLFRQPLEPLQGDLTLDRGVLKVSNVLARAAGGRITGMVGLDANRAEPEYSADVRWGGIELEQWLRPRNPAAQTNSPTGDRPGYVSGRLGGHAQLRGRGKSTAQWLASTDGSVQAWVRDGRLSHLLQEAVGLDVAQALGVLFVGDDFMPMRCAVVKANARNGTVTSEIAIADTRDSTLFATGAVGLADERLDLTVTARPKDISPVSLRAPIRVQGTFAAPRVALEGRRLGLRLAAAAALGAINPLAALIPLFDPGDQAAANACQQTLGRLRDADGPTGARDSKAPRPERVPGPARR